MLEVEIMALSKTVTAIISNQTISAASSSPSTGIDLSGSVDFGIGYQLTFSGTATLGARIDLYADPGGNSITFTVGTHADPCDAGDVALDAGSQVQGFFQMQRAAKYVKAVIVNLDTGQSITAASLWAIVQSP